MAIMIRLAQLLSQMRLRVSLVINIPVVLIFNQIKQMTCTASSAAVGFTQRSSQLPVSKDSQCLVKYFTEISAVGGVEGDTRTVKLFSAISASLDMHIIQKNDLGAIQNFYFIFFLPCVTL